MTANNEKDSRKEGLKEIDKSILFGTEEFDKKSDKAEKELADLVL